MSLSLINKPIYLKFTRSVRVIYSKKESKFAFSEKVYFYEKNDTIFRNQAVAYFKINITTI